MRCAALLVALASLACGAAPDPAAPAPSCRALRLVEAPRGASLVLVVNDTMRRDRLGIYGGPARTPSFDRFARDNLLFRRGLSQAPWTKPSVATLFTGLYPSQHGVLEDPRLRAQYAGRGDVLTSDVLAPELETLAELLRGAGLRTAAFVSNPWMDRPFGFAQGFEVYDDSFARFDAPGERVTRAGLDWLEALPAGERFFLYLHYIDAHQPYGQLSDEDLLVEQPRLDGDPRPLPAEGLTTLQALETEDGRNLLLASGARPTRALLERAYDEGIQEFDQALGALLAGLRVQPAYARTAVLVTSDHGEALFDRGYGNHARALFDDEIAVPMAARLPGVLPATGEVDCPVGLIDWLASFCDYFGLECPEQAGVSLLAGPGAGTPRFLAAEGVPDFSPHRAIRNDRYKLIYEPGGTLGPDLTRTPSEQPFSLFDLEADPEERHDLLEDPEPSPEVQRVFAALKEAMGRAIPPGPDLPERSVPIDAEMRRRLEELGYVERGGP
jgi:arylsulfatase A-like enzyme